jgi:chromosome segregation ATPase
MPGKRRRQKSPSISLSADAFYFYLRCPASFRDRAKTIPACVWDRKLACWIYPNRSSIRKKLLTEFGPELVDSLAHSQCELEEALREAREEAGAAWDEQRNLELLYHELGTRAEQLKDEVRNSSGRIGQLQQRNKDLEARFTTLVDERDCLRLELASQQQSIELQQQLAAVTVERDRFRLEVVALRERCVGLEGEMRELNRRLSTYQSRLAQIEEHNRDLASSTTLGKQDRGVSTNRLCSACGGLLAIDGVCIHCSR